VSCSFDGYHSKTIRSYCGRRVGQEGYLNPCSDCDGRCGPTNGCQCRACYALDSFAAEQQSASQVAPPKAEQQSASQEEPPKAGIVTLEEFLAGVKLSSFEGYFKDEFGVEDVSDFEGLGGKSWYAITNHLKEGRAFRLRTALEKIGLTLQEASNDDSDELKNEEDLCCVCLELPKNVVFLPCRHLCSCQNCSELPSLTNCPVCRCEISERLKVFG